MSTSDLCTVDYTVGWIPTSIGLTEADKQVLAAQRGINPDCIRGSYKILGGRCKHPVIKRGLALKSAIEALKDKFLLPELALVTTSGDPARKQLRRAKNSYVMSESSVDEFTRQFSEAQQLYLQWGVELRSDATYNELRAIDREDIAESWSAVEPKYPSQEALRDAIYVTVPDYKPVIRDFKLKAVDPELAARIQREAQQRLEATTAGIEALLLEQFQTFIESVRRSCGNVVKLNPAVDGEWSEYKDAVVVDYRELPIEDDTTPLCEVVIRKSDAKENQSPLRLPISFYREQLRPVETSEYRRLTDAAFANLLESTDKIARFRNQLRETDDKEFLSKFAKEVESALRDYGRTPTGIANTIRNNSTRRDELRRTFDGLLTQLQESGTAVRARQFRSTRKIFNNLD